MNKLNILCRDDYLQKLDTYMTEYGAEVMPSTLFIYGNTATGKTFVLREFLMKARPHLTSVFVNCIECSTARHLFELIMYGFTDDDCVKTDSIQDFIHELNRLDDAGDGGGGYVIVLDNAECLRDMNESNVFMVFCRLQEFTHLNIQVVFVSQIVLEKFYPREAGEEILKIFVPNYTKDEVALILTDNFCNHQHTKSDEAELELFEQYLTIFLNVFFKACRDLIELRFMAHKYFKIYCLPIQEGTIERSDARKLWLNIAKPLKMGLSQLYMRFSESHSSDHTTGLIRQDFKCLELPLYDKYLLIAGFLASYNAPKDDDRLFVKHHGKQKKRAQQANNVKVSEKTKLQLGPKSFTDDRLWTIFESILGKKLDRTVVMEARALTLVNLRFFRIVSGENSFEGKRRMACNIGLDLISSLSQSIEFDIRPYLQFFTK